MRQRSSPGLVTATFVRGFVTGSCGEFNKSHFSAFLLREATLGFR